MFEKENDTKQKMENRERNVVNQTSLIAQVKINVKEKREKRWKENDVERKKRLTIGQNLKFKKNDGKETNVPHRAN